MKKVFLKTSQNAQVSESLFNKVASLHHGTLSENETLVQVFSFEIYNIFHNKFFTEHLRTTASGRALSYVFPDQL